MTFDIRPLLTLSFWFDVTPDPLIEDSTLLIRLVFGAFLLLGIAARIAIVFVRENTWHLRRVRKTSQLFLSMGALGFFLYWFAYERFPFLSMRLWVLLWAVGVIVWCVFLAIYILKTVPDQQRATAVKKEKEKYLP